MLLRQGWAVDIFERVDRRGSESGGAGVAGHAELTAILASIGVSSERPPGIDVSGRVAFDRHGNQLASFAYPQYLTSWSSLFNLLHAAFPKASLSPRRRTVWGSSTTSDGAVAYLSGGERIAGDLIVGADGIRSKVRGLLAPDIVMCRAIAAIVAWRGIMG